MKKFLLLKVNACMEIFVSISYETDVDQHQSINMKTKIVNT